METKLVRIADRAKRYPGEVFTSLYHVINQDLLLACHQELDGKKATGIDQVTKQSYEKNLTDNINRLVEQLKRKAYRPQAVKRVYIPKGEGNEQRPLGISCYEDKIVQLALKKILEALFEPLFLEDSYGFRPNRNAHQAIQKLDGQIKRGKVNYIVDADIQGFFQHVNQEWLIKCIQVRMKDPNILRLLQRLLKAGILEEGEWEESESGTPQGSIISPLLANIYLHYVLDLWFEKGVKPNIQGEGYIVRYADDFVCGFQYEEDARNFLKALVHQLAKYSLKINSDKSKIIQFGRFAEEDRAKKGLGKPETFDFLGFTHFCSQSRIGRFRVKRKTSRKKFQAKIVSFKEWIKANRHKELTEIFTTVKAKLIGHYRYYGITDNSRMITRYRFEVEKLLFKWLNRRSQRKSFTFDQFNRYLERYPLPNPKIYVSVLG